MLNRSPRTSVLNMGTGAWQPCLLTWYDPALGGINSGNGAANPNSPTASGEPYDPNAYTCAAPPAYAFGTQIMFKVGGTAIQCRVNDRGGAIQGSHFDLSRAAANALGIIGAGRAQGSFQVVGVGGAPPAAQGAGSGQDGAGPLSVGNIANDLLNPLNPLGPLDLVGAALQGSVGKSIVDGFLGLTGDVAGKLALVLVAVGKDAATAIGSMIILPAWHWNQRAVAYYSEYYLIPADKEAARANWTALPWTAAFWGFGYYLLWTDPDQKGLKPAPPNKSRLARHVRRVQAVPARKALVKPGDVKAKTPKKPKPVVSAAPVRTTGTLRTERAQTVRVTGDGVAPRQSDKPTRSEVPIQREGAGAGVAPGREQSAHPASGKPDATHRTGTRSPTHRTGHPAAPPSASPGAGHRVGRGRTTPPSGGSGGR